MRTMPKPYPKEFREDVVRVARGREPGVTLEQIAADFGVHPITLSKWLRRAAIDDGVRPGVSREEARELRDAMKRIRLLEQENEVLRRAAAYLSQANLPGKGSTRS
jgi:transposase